MSQRLSQLAVDSILCDKVHPQTGEPIVPLGFRASGRPIWPIMGAAPDDDEGGDDEGDDDTDEGAEDGDDEGDEQDDSKKAKIRNPRVKELSDEVARKRVALKEARKREETLAAQLKEFQDKDKGDTEKLSESVKELTTRAESAESKVGELALQVAFLSDKTHQWRNPKAALRLADLSEVEIDEDGEVTGLDEALKALAKSDPYLLQGKDDDDEDDEDPPKRVGEPPKTKKSKGTAERDKLLAKYPALRR